MRRGAAAAVLCAAGAAAQHFDPFAGSGCNCSAFCAGSCAINATAPRNVTLYRMTPLHVDDLSDKNTGDGRGDTSYVMSRRTSAYDCAHSKDPSQQHRCATLVVAGDDPNSTDLVIQFTVEVDGQWGPYLFCNPTDATHPDAPWNCTAGSPGGSGKPPADYPAQCKAANYSGAAGYCFSNAPSKVVTDVDLAECCEQAEATKQWGHSAYGYTYYNNNRTCGIFSGYHNHAEHCDGVIGFYESGGGTPVCDCPRVHQSAGRMDLSAFGSHGGGGFNPYSHVGGEWYSTTHDGECQGSDTPGGGACSWRTVDVPKAVNASCIYDRIDTNIEKRSTDCFDACPATSPGYPWKYNRTSECYSECYSKAAMGMTPEEIDAPWALAFSSADPAQGGCPPAAVPGR